jgi:hypothetical protein
MVNRRRLAAVLLVAAPLISVAAELAAGAAWRDPPYDPVRTWVSHLGVPGPPQMVLDQVANSPLAWVMNTGWLSSAILIGVAGLLLFRTDAVLGVLGMVEGAGGVLVALVPSTQHNIDTGLVALHDNGARMVGAAGVLFVIAAGVRHGPRLPLLATGIAALVAGVVFWIDLRTGALWNIGLFERLTLYSIGLGQVLFGLVNLRHGSGPPARPINEVAVAS